MFKSILNCRLKPLLNQQLRLRLRQQPSRRCRLRVSLWRRHQQRSSPARRQLKRLQLWRLLSFPLTLLSTVQSIFSTILSSTTTEFTTITETILITWSENYLTSAISENTSNSPNRNIQEVFRLISLDFGTIPNSEYRTESLAIDLMSREFPNRWHSYIPNRWHSYTVRFRTYSWRPLLIHLNVQQVRTFCFNRKTLKRASL